MAIALITLLWSC